MRTAGRPDDRGAMLVMAIVFITVIGMVIAGALSYASVSIHSAARVYAPARDRLYTADAAMKTTVAYVMAHPAEGRSIAGGGCKPVRTYGAVRGDPVTVQVCPQGAASLTAQGGGTGWGLITLATGAERGLDVKGDAGAQVNGNLYANSSVAVEKGSLIVNGGVVQALGGCTGSVIVDGVPLADCTVPTPPGVDPGYTVGITAAPPDATGSCNSSTDVATLGPGRWTESAFDDALDSCDYIWLQPGVHYLEDIDWTIKGKVIAGTLTAGTAGMATSAISNGCVKGGDGVTIILGGETTVNLSGSTSSLEVCGRTVVQGSGAPLKLPIYGPTQDISSPVSGTLATTSNPSGSGWSSAANAKAIDGTVATYNLAKNRNTQPLSLPGFSGTPISPTVRTLTVTVNAVTSQPATITTLTARNSGQSSDACSKSSTNPSLPVGTAVSAATVTTVTLTCTKALVAPLTFRLVVTSPNSGSTRSVKVDGIAVGFTDAGRVIEAQSGCVVEISGCAVLSTKGNGNVIWLDGEVYLPAALVSLKVPNISAAFSTLGVVVRSLVIDTTGSTAVVPVVALDNGALNPGDVTVTTKIADAVWMTCRVTFGVSGETITSSTVQACTVPR